MNTKSRGENMGIWNFLDGNKIGPGHPRYERELRKHNGLWYAWCFKVWKRRRHY
ncbi:MAG: hypothetical protein ACRC8P_00460 [Spiroplasma sp.]